MPGSRGLHSSTFRRNVFTFLWDTLGILRVAVSQTAQIELRSGRPCRATIKGVDIELEERVRHVTLRPGAYRLS